jgi:predicted GNAT family N-acyltransferase
MSRGRSGAFAVVRQPPSGPSRASAPDAAAIEVRWARSPEDLSGAVAVREQVFCTEQGVSKEEELDGLDDQALHLVAVDREGVRVVGTLRLLVVGRVAKIGRVAVESRWRRRGIASRMLEMALLGARERGCRRARLASQLHATRLYEEAGFDVESEPFEEAGIPHVWMGRRLEAPSRG